MMTKEEIRAYYRDWYKKNKDKRREYYIRYKEKCMLFDKPLDKYDPIYYREHKEEMTRNTYKWIDSHRDQYNAYQRNYARRRADKRRKGLL